MGVFFEKNIPFEEGGGITSKIIPYRFTKAGIGAGFAISGAAALGKEMLVQHNKVKMGPVSYGGGPARMTNNLSSGAIEAIKEVTKDPQVQQDMLRKVLHDSDSGIVNNLEEYGVDGEFISAFYGM